MRKQFTDCFTATKVNDVTASSSANGTANSAHYDSNICYSPSVMADVTSLAANKTLTLKIQHSDTTTSSDFADVTDDYASSGTITVPAAANGLYRLYYTGQKRYIRLRVTSVEASPGATVRVYWHAHNLYEKPDNSSFA